MRVLLSTIGSRGDVQPLVALGLVDEVSQRALFKRVAAVVHHGGAGTTTMAALVGAATAAQRLVAIQRQAAMV